MQQKIGLITTGGDCAGLNAAIRAVVTRADVLGQKVIGFRRGLHGVAEGGAGIVHLHPDTLPDGLLQMGGTILGAANRSISGKRLYDNDWNITPYTQMLFDAVKSYGITNIVVIGGDGSFGLFSKLASAAGWRTIFIPKTIDNDVVGTDAAIGFDSAVSVATEALDRLRPTAASHDRVMVLEVMGRDVGHIALSSAIAGGADIVLIPEIPYDFSHIANKLKAIQATGRRHALIVVSEAIQTADGQKLELVDPQGNKRYGGIGQYIAERITSELSWEARSIVLGHVQRGAEPTYRDRLLATMLGIHAVDLVHAEQSGRVVCLRGGRVIDIPVEEATGGTQPVDLDGDLVKTARAMGISLGGA